MRWSTNDIACKRAIALSTRVMEMLVVSFDFFTCFSENKWRAFVSQTSKIGVVVILTNDYDKTKC